MDASLFGLLQRVHGHLAVLSLALLLHPVITLRTRRVLTAWTVRSAWIAAVMLSASFALGWWIYPAYRSDVKPGLLAGAPRIAAAFESKEHLAFCAAALAVAGALVLVRAGSHAASRRLAGALLLGGWLCGVTTGALGIFVASAAQPGW